MRATSIALAALVLAGCFGPGSPDDEGPDGSGDASLPSLRHLAAPGAEISDDGANRTSTWSGELGQGGFVPLVGPAPESDTLEHSFSLDAAVGTLVLALEASGGAVAELRDEHGHLLCAPRADRVCSVAPALADPVDWTIALTSLAPEGTSYEVRVTISPYAPVYGDDPTPPAGWLVDTAGVNGGEPTLGVTADGRALVVAGGDVVRWNGPGSWTDVTPPLDAAAGLTLDPFLVGDPITGRIWVSQLAVCQRIAYTDDAGESWTSNPLGCGGPDQHHQKLAVGPGPAGRVVHMMTMNLGSWLATDETVITHAASHDGGITWIQSPALTAAVHGIEARAIGNVATSEDGTVSAIAYLCDAFVDAEYEGLAVGVSRDGGATWDWTVVGPPGGRCEGIDPGLASYGSDIHAFWWDPADGVPRLRYSRSTDDGATWPEPNVVPTPGLGSFVFTDAAATAGRVAIAFLATPDTTIGPSQAPGWSRWYAYAGTLDLTDPAAGWEIVRLEDHPVQLGQICKDGPACLDNARNLLDFIDVQLGPDGGVYVAYADGCDSECLESWQSRGSELHLAVKMPSS